PAPPAAELYRSALVGDSPMATISLAEHEGERILLVRCFEPMTKRLPADPPSDRQLLQCAVAASPGARLQQIGDEHLPFAGDFGDARYDFALAVMDTNVLALRATGFEWSPEALAAVTHFAFPEDRVRQVRTAALERVRKQQAELSEWLDKVRSG